MDRLGVAGEWPALASRWQKCIRDLTGAVETDSRNVWVFLRVVIARPNRGGLEAHETVNWASGNLSDYR
jgi:hypothetical protein